LIRNKVNFDLFAVLGLAAPVPWKSAE